MGIPFLGLYEPPGVGRAAAARDREPISRRDFAPARGGSARTPGWRTGAAGPLASLTAAGRSTAAIAPVCVTLLSEPLPRSRRPARRVRRLRHRRARARRRAPDLLRALRAPAPRAGVGRHRHRPGRPHHDDARPGARQPGVRRAEAARAAGATWRSGTSATRPPARARGRTRSPCGGPTGARSRSPTTATWSTRSSCTASCAAAAWRSARRRTRRSSPRCCPRTRRTRSRTRWST